MNTPSAEALSLAVKLSGHTHCQRTLTDLDSLRLPLRTTPCDGCLSDAAMIDRELQLPQRNVALLLAQAAVETYESSNGYADGNIMEQLRESLAAIKTA